MVLISSCFYSANNTTIKMAEAFLNHDEMERTEKLKAIVDISFITGGEIKNTPISSIIRRLLSNSRAGISILSTGMKLSQKYASVHHP